LVFEGIKEAIVADRYAYFDDFFANFYNTDMLAPERIGDAALRASFQVAAGSSPYATYACVDTWLTDFRGDLPKIDVPTLVVHGTADRILPFEATAGRLRDEHLIADLTQRLISVLAADRAQHAAADVHARAAADDHRLTDVERLLARGAAQGGATAVVAVSTPCRSSGTLLIAG
jgi:hypothetical protein